MLQPKGLLNFSSNSYFLSFLIVILSVFVVLCKSFTVRLQGIYNTSAHLLISINSALTMRKHLIYNTRASGLQSLCTAFAMKLPFLLRERLRDSVQYDRQDHDTQSRLESFRDIVLLNTLVHDASEPPCAYHGGNHHHGQGQQDHLVHP